MDAHLPGEGPNRPVGLPPRLGEAGLIEDAADPFRVPAGIPPRTGSAEPDAREAKGGEASTSEVNRVGARSAIVSDLLALLSGHGPQDDPSPQD